MGHSRSQHFMLASRDIESVTRRVGRWGFSKVCMYLRRRVNFGEEPLWRGTRTHAAREGYMAADEQLVGHALVSAEEAKRAVSVLEAKQGGTDHLLQALQAQVTQLANRVEASEEALRAERARGMERLHDQAERLREKAETSEAALRKRVDELVQRLEAQAKVSERALRDNAQRSEQSLRT